MARLHAWVYHYLVTDTKTTAPALTDAQIITLRTRAAAEGDEALVNVCWLALGEGLLTATTPDRDAAREQLAAVVARHRADILAALASHDRGDGGLGIIVDEALAEDPAVTVAEVREIVIQAERDAADEASR